jgi:hypothetical protein
VRIESLASDEASRLIPSKAQSLLDLNGPTKELAEKVI